MGVSKDFTVSAQETIFTSCNLAAIRQDESYCWCPEDYKIQVSFDLQGTQFTPNEYTIEGLPKPIDVKSKFGSFHSDIQVKDKEICIIHRLFMSKGVYSPDEYATFIDFRKQVAGQYSGKIILKKE